MSGEIHLKNVILIYLYILDPISLLTFRGQAKSMRMSYSGWLKVFNRKASPWIKQWKMWRTVHLHAWFIKRKGISWAYIHWHKNDRNVSCPYRCKIKRENFNYFLFWGRYHKNFDMHCSCWFGNQYPRYKYCTYMGLT